jgi:hypothetical protein
MTMYVGDKGRNDQLHYCGQVVADACPSWAKRDENRLCLRVGQRAERGEVGAVKLPATADHLVTD